MSSIASVPIKKVLLATDGSENSERATSVATAIAKANGADLYVLSVVGNRLGITIPTNIPKGWTQYLDAIESAADKMVASVVGNAKAAGVKAKGEAVTTEPEQSVVEIIINKAQEQKVDLIVVGTRGLGGFKRMVMGSVSTGVVTHATCNVLVVR